MTAVKTNALRLLPALFCGGALLALAACKTARPDAPASPADAASTPTAAPASILAVGEKARVTPTRALFAVPDIRDDSPLADTREKILKQGTEVMVTRLEGARARVKLENGQSGLMRQADLEPIPPPEPEFSLFGSPGPHRSEGVEEDPPGPIDPALIIRSNDLPMPEFIP